MKYREKIYKYVKTKYSTVPEFLWAKFPNYAVLRHSENKKWYGLIMNVQKNKLGIKSMEKSDIINLKIGDLNYLCSLVRNSGFFEAYHMCKKNWVTIILDGTVPLNTILKLIDLSYVTTLK